MQPAQPGDPAGHPAQTVLPPTRTTTLWAAILCFLAAFGSAVGAVWAVYAQWVTDESFTEVSDHLTTAARSAIASMDRLNTVVGVLNVILAVWLLVGGIMLLRRKPAGRMVVAAACAVSLVGAVIVYIISSQIWNDIVAAIGEIDDVEVWRIGPGLGTAIRAALGAAVILGLVLAPSTKRWLTGQGQPAGPGSPLAPGPVGTLDSSQPAPSGRTAITAAVMSLLSSVLFLVGTVAGVDGALSSDENPAARVVAGIVGGVCGLLAIGLITGGILLLRRRFAGAITLVVCWAAYILVAFAVLAKVVDNDRRPPEALPILIPIVVITVAWAVAVIVLAQRRTVRRWCAARAVTAPAVAAPQ
ncbi:hypothetical protein MINS_21110 [Mycolicibacterium insubricum]|uniref:Uncharacterized protein n=1 Tax=Mycolicibacterium insubricum TaxID=444597 RepID=A0A1X0DE20_9MYCO|nr:hypothetical protein [Mycolicibacterium insubricum]MCB9439920.1 hypothetical protein [Mycolicibacterium sp.]MCV7080652.1 hypothetical protein [Mycolicibacterium insubricum]ORA70608.1 hypothetical protein BST26_10585 [Mycolicibacterium insubricum]BBZ66682.1 hypothetical protein MINS_21110 [Mycolicibacterium insubricum]